MRSLLAVSLVAFASTANAAEGNLCGALEGLKIEAQSSHAPQRISIFKVDPMEFACGRTELILAQDTFCAAAGEEVGIEFTHAFPWKIWGCLKAQHIRPGLELVDQYTGLKNRKKVRHLWARWHDGTRLDILFEPTGDEGTEPRFKDYWGVYKLVVWRP